MNLAYKKKNFNIYNAGNGYIIHNIKKEFSQGHTHINNFKTAKYLVDLSIHKSMPHHLHHYFLVSLKRLSDDDEYTKKLSELIEVKEKKLFKDKQNNYRNRPKHFKRRK